MSKSTSLPEQVAPINREHWLTLLGEELATLIEDRTGLMPAKYRIACGFPSTRARAEKDGRIGECHHRNGNGYKEIFIHPKLDNENIVEVAATVLHELLHAALPLDAGHKAPFAKAATACGLAGKPTATTAGEDLTPELKAICDKLGKYPHDGLTATGKKQNTNLLKVGCVFCGYLTRTTRVWGDEAGWPICPTCDVQFEQLDKNDRASDPLVAVETFVEYKVKPVKVDPKAPTIYDPRWSLQSHKRGREVDWFVIDYGTATLGLEQPRLTPAPTREDALALLNSLREGIYTYEDLEINDESPEWDDDETDEFDIDPEDREIGDWSDDDAELADDEDETPDNDDGNPEDEDAFEAEQEKREAIAVGDRDRFKKGAVQERELGSMQYRLKV